MSSSTKSRMRAAPDRVLIVDQHPLFREAVAARFTASKDLNVFGEASGISEAMALVHRDSPSLVIVGLLLRDGHGLELIKEIRALDERIKQVVLTMYDEAVFGERAYLAGASGYINKSESGEVVLKAVRTVLGGDLYFGQATIKRMLSRVAHRPTVSNGSTLAGLSDREMEVFQLIGAGLATRAIATRLKLSIHTIDSHRDKIKRKLGINSGSQLIRNAIQYFLEQRLQLPEE
jgi:DNA-binding NarL/FixJ family response regulator